MVRRVLLTILLMIAIGMSGFGQTAALRDYVGMISQTFHPDVIAYLEKLKGEIEKRGNTALAKEVDRFVKGDSGTGFIYVASNGNNYVITNYHVISQAVTLNITFEKQDGEKTKFSDLTIVAADEDMDIALLTFAGGQKPFKEGLHFVTRTIQEGDDVYSAGFPGLGSSMLWQLGRGMVSNASVRIPSNEDEEKLLGPYIQHTAQVDPGNSGGPLLMQTQGVPTGFAVAGINTLSAQGRQSANYSIPISRVQSFLDAALKPPAADQHPMLEGRVTAFVDGLKDSTAAYAHIAKYISNSCTGENAEYAINEMLEKAPRAVAKDILDQQIITVMTYSVAWTIEHSISSRSGKIDIKVDSITPNEQGGFTVAFKVDDKTTISSEWMREYGIWRIKSFGDFAAGDKLFIEKKKKEKADAAKLRANPNVQLSLGVAPVLERDDGISFGLDLVIRGSYTGYGMRGFFGKGFVQVDAFSGLYIPIKMGAVALTPFANIGFGMQVKDQKYPVYDSWGTLKDEGKLMFFGFPIEAGLQFTTAAVPGLYFQAAYQYNAAFGLLHDDKEKDPNVLFFSIGYAF